MAGEERRRVPVDEQRVHEIAEHVQAIIRLLRLDAADPNLAGTPERVAEAYFELLSGEQSPPELTSFANREGISEPVVLRDIPVYSLCAHHWLPFFGQALVAYVPGERIVGLSKLARVVQHFARRPQVQERLTEQIVGCLEAELRPVGALAVIEARHLCMEMRGVRLPGTLTRTTAMRGAFADAGLRERLLAQVRP
jgi:GTP cyclohydrolase IA